MHDQKQSRKEKKRERLTKVLRKSGRRGWKKASELLPISWNGKKVVVLRFSS